MERLRAFLLVSVAATVLLIACGDSSGVTESGVPDGSATSDYDELRKRLCQGHSEGDIVWTDGYSDTTPNGQVATYTNGILCGKKDFE